MKIGVLSSSRADYGIYEPLLKNLSQNKKIEFEYYATLGQINKICSQILELATTPIADNLKIAANLTSLAYKLLNSLDNPQYNDLIQNFPSSSLKMKAEFHMSKKNLIQTLPQ